MVVEVEEAEVEMLIGNGDGTRGRRRGGFGVVVLDRLVRGFSKKKPYGRQTAADAVGASGWWYGIGCLRLLRQTAAAAGSGAS